jgi:hypothetical protein
LVLQRFGVVRFLLLFENQGRKGTENVPILAKKRPVFRLRLGKNSMQGMLTWERLKKMCSNGKEVINYSVLCSQRRADQTEFAKL